MPKIIECKFDETYQFIAMDVVGQTLEALSRKKPFSPLTVAMIGVQLISAVEGLHAADFLHRDIKPDNLASAFQAADSSLYLLDVGVACKYKICGCCVRYAEGVPFTGNYAFCSCSVLKGVKPSRRDDLESLAYVLVYLRSGFLPWNKLDSDKPASRSKHLEKKLQLSPSKVCAGMEAEHQQFLTYCRALSFDEQPNYHLLRGLFQDLAVRLGFTGLWEYSWLQRQPSKTSEARREGRAATSHGPKERRKTVHQCSPSPVLAVSPLPRLPNSDFGVRRCKRRPKITVVKLSGEDILTPLIPAILNIDSVRRKLKEASTTFQAN